MINAIQRLCAAPPPLLTEEAAAERFGSWSRGLPSPEEQMRFLSLGDHCNVYYSDADGIPSLPQRSICKLLLLIKYGLDNLFFALRIKKRLAALSTQLGESLAELTYIVTSPSSREDAGLAKCTNKCMRLQYEVGRGLSRISRKMYPMSVGHGSPAKSIPVPYHIVASRVVQGYIKTINSWRGRRKEIQEIILKPPCVTQAVRVALWQVVDDHCDNWTASEIRDRLLSDKRIGSCLFGCVGCRPWEDFFKRWDDLCYPGHNGDFEARLLATAQALVDTGLICIFSDHPMANDVEALNSILQKLVLEKISQYVRKHLTSCRYTDQEAFAKALASKMQKKRIAWLKKLIKPRISIWQRIIMWMWPFDVNIMEDYKKYVARIAPGGTVLLQEVDAYVGSGRRGPMEFSETAEAEIEKQAMKAAQYILQSRLFEGLVREYVVQEQNPSLETD